MAPTLERILVALAVACAVVLLLAGLGRRLRPRKAREARVGLRSRVRTAFWLTFGLLAGSTTPARAAGPLPESGTHGASLAAAVARSEARLAAYREIAARSGCPEVVLRRMREALAEDRERLAGAAGPAASPQRPADGAPIKVEIHGTDPDSGEENPPPLPPPPPPPTCYAVPPPPPPPPPPTCYEMPPPEPTCYDAVDPPPTCYARMEGETGKPPSDVVIDSALRKHAERLVQELDEVLRG